MTDCSSSVVDDDIERKVQIIRKDITELSRLISYRFAYSTRLQSQRWSEWMWR